MSVGFYTLSWFQGITISSIIEWSWIWINSILMDRKMQIYSFYNMASFYGLICLLSSSMECIVLYIQACVHKCKSVSFWLTKKCEVKDSWFSLICFIPNFTSRFNIGSMTPTNHFRDHYMSQIFFFF